MAYLASLLLAYLNPAPVVIDHAWNGGQSALSIVRVSHLPIRLLPVTPRSSYAVA